MPVVRFGFDHPSGSGEDAPAVGRVECQLLTAETGPGGRVRSTRAFSVWLSSGEGTALLSPTGPDQAWHVRVVGVPGFAEAWVDVPDVDGEVSFNDLPRIDPSSVPVGPANLRRWAEAVERAERAEAIAAGTTQAAEEAATLAAASNTRALDAVDKANAATSAVANAVATASAAAADIAYQTALDSLGPLSDSVAMAEPAQSVYFPGLQEVRVGMAGLVWSRNVYIRVVTATVSSAPRGTNAYVRTDVLRNGVPVNPNGATGPAIKFDERFAAINYGEPGLLVTAGTAISVSVTQVGTTDPGSDLVVTFKVRAA